MLRILSASCALALVAGAASARNYTGSDTLRVFTQTLVTQCGATGSFPALAGAIPQFSYLGGGSSAGGVAMRSGEQDIAPQSRGLISEEACETLIEGNPSTGPGNLGNDEAAVTISRPGSGAEGLVIGLDAVNIAVNPGSGARCDTDPSDTLAAPLAFTRSKTFTVTNFTTNVPDGAPNLSTFSDVPLPAPGGALEAGPSGSLLYHIADFKDVLRILFAGADQTRPSSTGPSGGGGMTQSANNRLSRCSSDIRRSLISNWDNLVEGDPATCSGTSCGTLRRLYRRADATSTTETFLLLLGLATTLSQPFCNGPERADQDPIRRSCLPEDDVCGPTGNLGLLQTIALYPLVNVTPANLHAAWYPVQPCATGVFVLRDGPLLPGGFSAITCPDGSPMIFTQCLTPQAGPGNAVGAAVQANCLNSQLNTSFLTPGGNDGRSFNRELRSPTGNMRNELIAGQPIGTGITNAVYRTRSRPGGAGGQCLFDDDTQSIGCIAGNTACGLGFTEPAFINNPIPVAVSAPVGGVALTDPNFQALFDPALGTPYPLVRKLYINSILAFDRIRQEVNTPSAGDAEQEQLVRCLEQLPAAHQAALAAARILPLPELPAAVEIPGHLVQFRVGGTGTPGLVCEDVNEIIACASAPNPPTLDAPNCVPL